MFSRFLKVQWSSNTVLYGFKGRHQEISSGSMRFFLWVLKGISQGCFRFKKIFDGCRSFDQMILVSNKGLQGWIGLFWCLSGFVRFYKVVKNAESFHDVLRDSQRFHQSFCYGSTLGL